MKIKHKLQASNFVLALLLIIVGGAIYWQTEKSIQKNTDAQLMELTALSSSMIEVMIDTTIKNYLKGAAEKNRDLAAFFYKHSQAGDYSEEEARQRLFGALLSQKIGDTGYVLGVNSNVEIVFHPKLSQGTSVIEFDLFKKGLALKNGYLKYKWKNKGEEVARNKVAYISYFEPWDLSIWVSSYESEFMSLIDYESIQQGLNKISVGKTGYVNILDKEGKIVTHPKIKIGTDVSKAKSATGHLFIQDILRLKNGNINYTWKNPGEKEFREKFVFFKEIPKLEWIVMASSYVEDFDEGKNHLALILLIAMGALMVVLIPSMFLTARSIANPIHELVDSMKDLSQGEGDLTKEISLNSKDETRDLAHWFNKFIGNIKGIVLEIHDHSESVQVSSKDLKEISGSLVKNADQVAQKAHQVASTNEKLSSNIKTMTVRSEEMSINASSVSSTAEQISMNMNGLASAVEEMSMAIRDIHQTTQDGARIADEGSRLSKEATTSMNQLGDVTTEIGQVTDVIKRIAEQTNLLALNATIEAASAGDAGKGFAVVANEIKELASQSANAAEDINAKIGGMQEQSLTAIKVTSQVTDIISSINEAVSTISKAIDQQNSTATEISSSIAESNSGINNIASAISEIAKGAVDMSESAEQAAIGVVEVAESISETNNAADKTRESTVLVSKLSETLGSVENKLRELVGRFKVEEN